MFLRLFFRWINRVFNIFMGLFNKFSTILAEFSTIYCTGGIGIMVKREETQAYLFALKRVSVIDTAATNLIRTDALKNELISNINARIPDTPMLETLEELDGLLQIQMQIIAKLQDFLQRRKDENDANDRVQEKARRVAAQLKKKERAGE